MMTPQTAKITFQKIPLWLFVVFGLVLVNLGVFASSLNVTQLQLLQWVYYCDPTRWSPFTPLSAGLWLAALFLAVDTVLVYAAITRYRMQYRLCATLATIAVPLCWFKLHIMLWRFFDTNFYTPFVYGPLSEFFYSGKVPWHISIFIVAALALIAFLTRLPNILQNRSQGVDHADNKNSTPPTE